MNQSGDERVSSRLDALTTRAIRTLTRAAAAGDTQGIADAVTMFEEVEEIARQANHPDHWRSLINLADAIMAEAEAANSDDALNRVLNLLGLNEQSFHDPHPRLAFLARKGQALLMQALRTRDSSVMRRAVLVQRERRKMAPRGHIEHGSSMFGLGITLFYSGVTFNELADLEKSVAILESAERRPDPYVDRAAVLSALGNAHLSRYMKAADSSESDLVAALDEQQRAMEAADPASPNTLTILADFGSTLMRGYEETSDRALLDASVEVLRRTSAATPSTNYRKAERLNQLSSALRALNESTWDPDELDEAISASRAALAVDPGHASRASFLYGLASGLFRRAELRRTLFDFDEAAIRATEAVDASPDDYASQALFLGLKAAALCYLPTVVKLEQADLSLAEAENRLLRNDPERIRLESNHGVLLDALARFIGDTSAAGQAHAIEAVRLTRRAAEATAPAHHEFLARLVNYLVASATLARLSRDPSVLDEPLERCAAVQDQAESGTMGSLLGPACGYALTVCHELTGDGDAARAAIEAYQRGASEPQLAVFRRLDAAHAGAGLAVRCGEISRGLELYTLAIDLLDSAAWRGIARSDQERLLEQYAGLPSDAAAIAVTAGQPQTAVELLERGRGVLLNRLLDDSADLDRLYRTDESLVRRFQDLRHALDGIVIPDPEIYDFGPPDQETEADQRSALARQLDDLSNEIRALPGCADLFRSPHFPALHALTGTRSVAVINISAHRCDAIILTPDGITVTLLSDLTKADAERAAEFFRTRAEKASRSDQVGHTARAELTTKLAWLWDTIAGPVLRDTGMTETVHEDHQAPRLYWCPTGWATFLPLHAAGRHGTPAPSAPAAVIDCAESVYIPKLHALAPDHPGQEDAQQTSQPPLVVAMHNTPDRRSLPGAQQEADYLRTVFPSATYLSDQAATRDAVLAAMDTHIWFHFAGHGITDEQAPVEGGLELADGRLTIQDLARHRLRNARFAYLSACATYQGSPSIPDEAVTIGTALCVAGCHTVIATLWPVSDTNTADFSLRMYQGLISVDTQTPVIHPESSAHAVRVTARALRDAQPDHSEQWAPFICTASR